MSAQITNLLIQYAHLSSFSGNTFPSPRSQEKQQQLFSPLDPLVGLFSTYFARLVWLAVVLFGLSVISGGGSFQCVNQHLDEGELEERFTEALCSLPRHHAHQLHPGARGPENVFTDFAYYFYLILLLLVHAFLNYLPLFLFNRGTKAQRNQLLYVLENVRPQNRNWIRAELLAVVNENPKLFSMQELEELEEEGSLPGYTAEEEEETDQELDDLFADLESALTIRELLGKGLRQGFARRFALLYLASLALAAVILLAEIASLDLLFNGRFLAFGLPFLTASPTAFTDEALLKNNEIFPLVTTCHFPLLGVTGSPETVDALCVLEMNAYYPQLLAILWELLFAVLIIVVVALLWTALKWALFCWVGLRGSNNYKEEIDQVAEMLFLLNWLQTGEEAEYEEEFFDRGKLRWTFFMLDMTTTKGQLLRTIRRLQLSLWALLEFKGYLKVKESGELA